MQLNFNARTVEPAGPSSPQLPVSDSSGHLVVITSDEVIEVKGKKDNGYLALTLMVIEGEHKGAEGVYRLNLYNDNGKTVEIAYKQLSAICHVVNVYDIVDTKQLHNIPFRAVVALQKGDNPNGYTEVKHVLHTDGAAPGKSSGVSQQPKQQPPQFPVENAPNPPQQQATPGWNAGAGTSTGGGAGDQKPPWAK